MISGIFFSRFLPQEGTKVVHQSPPGFLVPEPDVETTPLFSFETMREYIIPRQAFCNRYVTMICPDNKYRILGHPVCIYDEKYERNEFMFNFGIVIGVEVDKTPYEAVVRRLASTFTEMEIQNQYLSQEKTEGGRRSIAALLEIIKEDLNNYNECMIPVDDANTINMKLFPIYTTPPPIKSWHVPISKMKFASIIDDTWDLTMVRILPHIDGIKDVRRIAATSSTSLPLTKLALQHLLYYDSIILLPLFLFSAIYAPTPSLHTFITSTPMQDECANYVYINGPRLSNYYLCRLFTTLCTSRTLKEWLKLHLDQGFAVLNFVDVRRFIQFGLIKGLIYRVHKYAVSAQKLADKVSGKERLGDSLRDYADGTHCFDQITVERNMGDAKIMDALRKFPKGDVEIIYR
ncbi:hypothetical protein GLAREA_08522 [Glarea lozoyensis ATCC 20868]|uniref:Nitrogen permease regulator 2 like protein n=1 Tax=Glarea lozoyensis (strain ATCC 20868 / MF5171) TaxID=1116229 RepID=S3CH95_GLAL2|nr:uncharacterized protein GLAREA_08522 [Glarea lozoyensis ATCC 20868]EPE24669.1 hypothetical protein GLAREA_08522 [Glarea lozoyensis ATCC 20868]